MDTYAAEKLTDIPTLLQTSLQQQRAGQLEQAFAGYQEILARDPEHVRALYYCGLLAHGIGDHQTGTELLRHAVAINGNDPEVFCNLGVMYVATGDYASAVGHYRTAIELKPDYADAYYNLAICQEALGLSEDVEANYRTALRLNPNLVEANYNLGVWLCEHSKKELAEPLLIRATQLRPEFSQSWLYLARINNELGRNSAAIELARKGLRLSPNDADLRFWLARFEQERGDIVEAFEEFQRVLSLNPGHAEAWRHCGLLALQLGDSSSAVTLFKRASDILPDNYNVFDNLLFSMQYCPTLSSEVIFAEHRRFSQIFEAPLQRSRQPHANPRIPDKRLKLGYISADFYNHSVAFFIEPIIAHHDADRFEVYCYYNNHINDDFTQRFQSYAHHWLKCDSLNDDALAEQIRNDGIDILIDLSGHTSGNRLLTFARKPAPVQVTWIGYAGTTGLNAMDYRLTDKDLDPPLLSQPCHSETLFYLSSSCFKNIETQAPEITPLPALNGQPFTFACLNTLSKITDTNLRIWAEILAGRPGSRLMFGNAQGDYTQDNLIRRMAAFGISSDRLIFQPRQDRRSYLALHNSIDLALDPFPYNGGTTTTSSLWMGVPVITLAGDRTTSRVGVTLLMGAGLAEFVTQSEQDYVAKALEISGNLPKLAELRLNLRSQLLNHPAYDAVAYTREVETAYRSMWQTWCNQSRPT